MMIPDSSGRRASMLYKIFTKTTDYVVIVFMPAMLGLSLKTGLAQLFVYSVASEAALQISLPCSNDPEIYQLFQ